MLFRCHMLATLILLGLYLEHCFYRKLVPKLPVLVRNVIM